MKLLFSTMVGLFISLNAFSQIDSLLLDYEYFKLNNGLQVILQPDKNAKNVSVEFWLKDGYRIDQPNQYGLSHFFEHVMPWEKLDSTTRASYNSYRTGSNAQVKKDYSRYFLETRPEGLEIHLKIVSGRLSVGAKSITEKRVEFQRKRVLAEIKRNAKVPNWSAPGGMAIYSGVFGKDHPYGSSGYGYVKNNQDFTLQEFHKRYNEIVYANNTILFLVGNFDPNEAKKMISNYFADIPSTETKKMNVPRSKHSKKSLTMKAPYPKDTLNTMILSWNIPKWGTKEEGTLRLVTRILDHRLKKNDRLSSISLKSSVYSDFFQYGGILSAKVQFIEAKDSTEIVSITNKEVQKLSEYLISNQELYKTKQGEVKDIIDMQKYLGFQWSRTELLGEGLLFKSDPVFYFKRLKKQMNTNEKSIKRTANKWLNKKPFQILFLAN